jgi:hypothetical protein
MASIAEPREPSDFAEILTLSEAPLLVGGQAVNVWAEHFASKDSRLDAELLATRFERALAGVIDGLPSPF